MAVAVGVYYFFARKGAGSRCVRRCINGKYAKYAKVQSKGGSVKEIAVIDLRDGLLEHFHKKVRDVLSRDCAGVVLRLESCGGAVHEFGKVYQEVLLLKQNGVQVTCCIDRYALSGGYLIAAAADKVLANPFAEIGSIGVVTSQFKFKELLARLGVGYEQLTSGKYKQGMTSFLDTEPDQKDHLQKKIEAVHLLFRQKVALGRPEYDAQGIGSGESWLGSEAKELKLVDELKSSEEHLRELCKDHQVYLYKYRTKTERKAGILSVLLEYLGLPS
ncbi:MAG: S49 family peptidase [Sulfobacillus sp.]